MRIISILDFKKPDDMVYRSFVKLGFDKWSKEDFINKASYIVESIRERCWKDFKLMESAFIWLRN